MNYELNVMGQLQRKNNKQNHADQLEKQVSDLIEWKQKAMVQLQHFQTACSIYHFCDAKAVNELLDS